MSSPEGQELDLLRAITTLETRVMTAMATGMQAIQTQLGQLTESHHRALLEQERRNATFASRERVDELQLQIHELERRVSSRFTSFLTSGAGYLVTLCIVAGTAILTYILAHVH